MGKLILAHSARRGNGRMQVLLTPRRAGLRCALNQWSSALALSAGALFSQLPMDNLPPDKRAK